MKIIRALIVILILMQAACSTVERTMSGKIGCPHDKIKILDTSFGMGRVWKAQCGDEIHVCSFPSPVHQTSEFSDMSCKYYASASDLRHRTKLSSSREESFESFLSRERSVPADTDQE